MFAVRFLRALCQRQRHGQQHEQVARRAQQPRRADGDDVIREKPRRLACTQPRRGLRQQDEGGKARGEVRQPETERIAPIAAAQTAQQVVRLICSSAEKQSCALVPVLALVDEKLKRVSRYVPVDAAIRREAKRHEQQPGGLPDADAAALHGVVHQLPQQRHDQQQPERARERGICSAQPAEHGPVRAREVERRRRQQQKQALAHRRGEEKAARREHEKPQRAHGAAVRQVEPQQPVDHAPRARKAQRRCQQPRADVRRDEQHHRAHRKRVTRQKHELHDAVGVTGGDVAVARDVEIVPAVEAAPEFERLRERLRLSGEGAERPM